MKVLTTLFFLSFLAVPGLSVDFSIFTPGFYVAKPGTLGAQYQIKTDVCQKIGENGKFKYAAFVSANSIHTPYVPTQPFQFFNLSQEGDETLLKVDLQFGLMHERIQTTLRLIENGPQSLVFQAPFKGRNFTMTFKKISEGEIEGLAQENGREHGKFNLVLAFPKKDMPLYIKALDSDYTGEKAKGLCTSVADCFRRMCPAKKAE